MVAREKKRWAEEFAAIGMRLHTRIGLNTGSMVVASSALRKSSAIRCWADAVNTGARLEGANKFMAAQILASENTVAGLQDRFVMRELDRIPGEGRRQAVRAVLSCWPKRGRCTLAGACCAI